MSEILYPPKIEGTIPAQVNDQLIIPFQFTQMTSKEKVQTIVAIIKTVSTNQEIGILYSDIEQLNSKEAPIYKIIFDKGDLPLVVGQFYKIQLAFSTEKYEPNKSIKIGYYSTVGVFKYTTEASLSIQKEEEYYCYRGLYSQLKKDRTEKVYYYQFDLYLNNELIATTGKQIHNNLNDNNNISYDIWNIEKVLDTTLIYEVRYTVYTINQLIQTTKYFTTPISNENLPDLNYNLIIKKDFNNGCFNLFINNMEYLTDILRLYRFDKEKNEWIILKDLYFNNFDLSLPIFTDYTIEQGIIYQYAIQKIEKNNNGIIEILSNKIFTPFINIDFDSIFLFDGNKQLKLSFDSKISSFKQNIKDAKIETLGNQFPFILRNGNVNYSSFTIQGLISYLDDNDELFINKKNLGFYGTEQKERQESPSQQVDFNFKLKSTILDGDNIYSERYYRKKVLEWLNNGEVKLFRSSTEGNFLIKLTDINLTPNDTLSRMIYSFSGTAIEIDECSINNLKKYNII